MKRHNQGTCIGAPCTAQAVVYSGWGSKRGIAPDPEFERKGKREKIDKSCTNFTNFGHFYNLPPPLIGPPPKRENLNTLLEVSSPWSWDRGRGACYKNGHYIHLCNIYVEKSQPPTFFCNIRNTRFFIVISIIHMVRLSVVFKG